MLLAANGISKRYGANAVLSDVRFTVREKEVLGLIGPNGAGKTTLFECLGGLLPADGGTVEFQRPARRKEALFYMPDAIRPWPDQTVAWVLSYFEKLYGRSDGLALSESLKLTALLKSRIGALSKGESKRL